MTMLDARPDAPSPTSRSQRSDRRRMLDASIDRELRRGGAMSSTLPAGLHDVLESLLEQELRVEVPATEDTLLVSVPLFGFFRTARLQRRIEQAIRLGLARRERSTIRPTVAGLAAARPLSALTGSLRPSQQKLRELRNDEIGHL